MKFKREYELAIFATIIVISIIFSLYYAGFTGELPTGAAMADANGDTYSDNIEGLCVLAGAPPGPYVGDVDGDGIPDLCEPFIPGYIVGNPDEDGDLYRSALEWDAFSSTAQGLNPAITPTGCVLGGTVTSIVGGFQQTVTTYTCQDASGVFTINPVSLVGAFTSTGVVTSVANVAGPLLTITSTCTATPGAWSWNINIGDATPVGLVDTRGAYAVTADFPPNHMDDLTGSGTCPAIPTEPEPDVIYTGGGGGCNPRLRSPQVIKVSQTDNLVEILVEIQHMAIFRGLEPWVRVSYPLENQVKVESIEFMGLVDYVEGIRTPTNAPGIFKVTLNINPDGTPYYGRTDIFIGFGNDPDKCYVASTIELVETMIQKPTVVCSKEMTQQNIQIDVSDVGVDNGFFSFKVNAEFDPAALPCDYVGDGNVQLLSAQVLRDGAYLMGPTGKGKGGTVPIPGGFVSGGGIPGYTPEGGSAEPGAPPLPPAPGDGDKINMPFIIKVMVDGIIYSIPTTVSFPIPRITTTEVPTTTTDIPDKKIITFFEIPTVDYPPGFIPTPEPPIPGPWPDPNPPAPLPDPIQRIFFPGPTGKDLKLYADTVQQGEVSTDEGKKIGETKAFQLTNDVVNGRVAVYGPWGGRDEVVRLFLERGGEQVSALRSVILNNKAVPDLKVFTKETLPLGQFTVGEWGSNIALRTNTDGGAFYQMDYNSLEDGKYSLIAVSGNKVKMFYFEIAGGQVIFLKVPPQKLIANLKLIARTLGIPTTIKRLGGDEVILYYKDKNWNNEAGEKTVIPDDLT